METKLTLRLKKKVIDQAKKYANDHETSLSKLIENYLSAITNESKSIENISPLVLSPVSYTHLTLPTNREV